MSTNFGPIIYLLRSQEPKNRVIAARLQDDIGIPASSADAMAKMLVAVSKEAELIGDNGRFSASAIEGTHSALDEKGGLPEKPKPELRVAEQSLPHHAKAERKSSGSQGHSNGSGVPAGPLVTAPVQVVVNVDASKLSPQQVTELVRALQTPLPPIS